MLASADPAAAGQVIPTPSPTPMPAVKKKKKPTSAATVAPVKIVRDKTAPIFRATFMDNVKIVQTDQTLATANQMNVDFVMESSKASTQPTTDTSTPAAGAPTPAPAAKSESTEPKSLAAASRNAKNKPSPAPAPAAAPVAAPDKKRSKRGGDSTVAGATTSPTTQPEEAPITIYWTGKLRVTPLDAETQDPPTRQDEIVTLEGEPVTLHHGEGEVQCALVHYHTQDSSLRMESSKLTPMIVLNDGAGSTLRTPALDYSGAEGIAVFRGASKADLIVRNESTTQPSSVALASTTAPTTQPQTMVVSWTRTCRVFVTGDPQSGRQNMSIDRAEIDGDVEIHHPQIRGRSDTLDLAFEKVPTTRPVSPDATGPATEMALHDLDAEGKVHYVMMNEQKEQTIDCSHLTLETAKDKAGKTYPSAMNADGKVHAFDDTQDMRCGELAVKFQPTTKPSTQPANPQKFDSSSVELSALLARQDVHLSTKDGNAADADQLEMQTKDGVREVTLFGHPFARVVQKDSSLAGPIIKFDPDTNKAYVVGAGTMHAVQVAQDTKDKNAKPQPIDMNWGGNLSADGDLNIIDITEKVAISAKSSDGALNSANSDRLRVTLMDDPKAATRPTFPTTQKVKKPSPMASNGLGDTNFFKDKVVKVVEMQDNAQIQSVLNDAKGKLLRRLFMQAPLVRYFMQDKIFVVPSPGQMLMQDVSNSGKTNPELGGDATPNDMSGATVFTWQQELRYDETQHRMTMKGDVYIKHESSGDSKPFTLKCKQLTADLEPAPADATTQPSTAPATTAQAATPPTAAAPTTTAIATTAPATAPADASANQKMRLKHVTASDQVEFISLPIHFESTTIDYDPNTHMLVARGTDRVRASCTMRRVRSAGRSWSCTTTRRAARSITRWVCAPRYASDQRARCVSTCQISRATTSYALVKAPLRKNRGDSADRRRTAAAPSPFEFPRTRKG